MVDLTWPQSQTHGPQTGKTCYIGDVFKPSSWKETHYSMEDQDKLPIGRNLFRTKPGNTWNGLVYIPHNVQAREYDRLNKSYDVSSDLSRRFRPLAFISKAAENFTNRTYKTVKDFRTWFNQGGRFDYVKRLRAIAYVALKNGHDTVVLGAFGCG